MKRIFLFVSLFSLFTIAESADINWNDYYWEQVPITPMNSHETINYNKCYWLEMFFLPENPAYGYACGQFEKNSGAGVFAISRDSGKTWKACVVAPGAQFESVHFLDSLTGIVSGQQVYMTTDGGENWKVINFGSNVHTNKAVWGNWALGNSFWIGSGSCGTDTQYVLYSRDRGLTWHSTPISSSNAHITDIMMYEEYGEGYAIGSGEIWKTTDGGVNWNHIAYTPNVNWGMSFRTHTNWHEDIAIQNQSILIPISPGCTGGQSVGYGDSKGGAAFSPDMGKTWITCPGVTRDLFGSFLLNDTIGWACGYEAQAWLMKYDKNAKKVTWLNMNCGIPKSIDLDDMWFFTDTNGYICGLGGIFQLAKRPKFGFDIQPEEYCEGDTVTVRILDAGYEGGYIITFDTISLPKNVKVNKNTNTLTINGITANQKHIVINYDNFNNNSICSYKDTIKFNVGTRIKPILQQQGKLCSADEPIKIVLLNYDPSYENEWYNYGNLIAENVGEIMVNQSGKYYVISGNNGKCVASSDTIEVINYNKPNQLDISMNTNPLFVDSTSYGQTAYATISVRNISDSVFVLNEVYFRNKFAFTAPLSQFPITIQPHQTRMFRVVYAPTNLELQTDTLIISDNCTDKEIILEGFGTGNTDTSKIICDNTIVVSTRSIDPKYTVRISNPIPNPVGSQAKLIYKIEGHESTPNFNMTFFNSLSSEIAIDYNITQNEIIFNTSDIPHGIYYIKVQIDEEYVVLSFVK